MEVHMGSNGITRQAHSNRGWVDVGFAIGATLSRSQLYQRAPSSSSGSLRTTHPLPPPPPRRVCLRCLGSRRPPGWAVPRAVERATARRRCGPTGGAQAPAHLVPPPPEVHCPPPIAADASVRRHPGIRVSEEPLLSPWTPVTALRSSSLLPLSLRVASGGLGPTRPLSLFLRLLLLFLLLRPASGAQSPTPCVDAPGWTDANGLGCADYRANSWCANGWYGPNWTAPMGFFSDYRSPAGVSAAAVPRSTLPGCGRHTTMSASLCRWFLFVFTRPHT